MTVAEARVVGTAGHIDHGKTELVAALTGVATDRLPEERTRGISIDLGFAPLELGVGGPPASVVDVPGHEGFIKNMVAGATGIDAALLVVAADEGMMPQSREHLLILEALGVDRGVVAVTKTDLVEPEWVDLIVESVREELESTGLAAAPIIAVSSRTGEGIDELKSELAGVVARAAGRVLDFPFRLPVDRAFTVPGAGTVVTGTVWSGSIEQGDRVRVLPEDLEGRVRSIEVHGEAVESASAGRRTAIALTGVDGSALSRGSVLLDSTHPWRAVRRIDAHCWIAESAPRVVKQRTRIRLHHGTSESIGRVSWYGAESVRPGEEGIARIMLESPVVPAVGDRFVLRAYSPVEAIGGGTVLALSPRRLRGRAKVDRAGQLRRLADSGGEERLIVALDVAGGSGIAEGALSIETGLGTTELDASRSADSGLEVHRGHWFSRRALDAVKQRIIGVLEQHHVAEPLQPGLSLEAMRQRALPAHVALIEAALNELIADGRVERRGTEVSLADHVVRLEEQDRAILDQIRSEYAEAGVEAPGTEPLAQQLGLEVARLRDLQRVLESSGDIVKLASDWYIDSNAVRRAEAIVVDHLRSVEGAETPTFKELFGISRKYLIPLLEYLDRTGVTRREGNLRVLGGSS